MPRTRPPEPPEFRERMVRSRRTPAELAREFEPSEGSIRTSVKQADLDEGRRDDGPTADEKEEQRRLRRILKKAAVWFARESDSVPPKSSSS